MNKDLNEVINLAKNTPFYKKIIATYTEDILQTKALLCKRDLQESKDEMLIQEYRNARKGNLKVSRTSGSTGDIVEVYWNDNDQFLSNLCLWRARKNYYGIYPSDKYLSFHSIVYMENQVIDPRKVTSLSKSNNYSISKFDFGISSIDYYIEKIRDFKPKWIFTQPSMIMKLIELINEKNYNPTFVFENLKYIELTGETLLKSEKKYISNYFGVPVANMYGCNEMNSIALECPYGHMHIFEDNVKVQLKNAHEINNVYSGDILVTSLKNKIMPIVSYDLGDKVKLYKTQNCKCGVNGLTINSIISRKRDTITSPNNESVSVYEITYCIEYINSIMRDPILQFQLSKECDKIIIKLRIKNEYSSWKLTLERELKNIIFEYCKINKNSIVIQFTNEVNYSDTGKKSMIVRE